MEDNVQDFGGIQLTEEDYAFMEFIQSEITEDGQLPFEYPLTSMPKVIKRAALFFYQEADDATEEQWYLIRNEDMIRNGLNKTVKLPDDIQEVYELHQVNSSFFANCQSCSQFTSMFLRGGLMGSGPINGTYSGNRGNGIYANYHERDMAFEESVVRLFEIQQFQTLFRKGVRFAFNTNTKNLQVLGSYQGDLVLAVFRRIPLQKLYNDRLFIDYVTASCLSRLGRVLRAFGFKYPGEVEIDVDAITNEAKDRMKEIEQEIKDESSPADIILIN